LATKTLSRGFVLSQSTFHLVIIFIRMLNNIHDANLFQPITLRRQGA